jgi:FkbM family methyltransferase
MGIFKIDLDKLCCFLLLKRRFIKLRDLLSFYLKLNLHEIYQILQHSMTVILNYKIQVYESGRNKIYFGILGDRMFEEFLTNEFREVHFLDLIDSIYKEWNNLYGKKKFGQVLDIGSNIGSHSIKLAEKFTDSKIYAFEANPLIFPLLQLNTKDYNNIQTKMLAVSNRTGDILGLEALTYLNGKTNSGWFGTSETKSINPCISIKCDDMNFDFVFFIKIDIQGGELKALEGLAETIKNYSPIIFIEIDEFHLQKNGNSSQEVLRFILNYGYQVYRFETEFPTDHVAVPKHLDIKWIKTNYKLTNVPKEFKSLYFTHKSYYERVIL